MDLDTQHCLAIAAAFIAVIGACANLISGANSKAESLAGRIREAAKEHRLKINEARCEQIREQINLFKLRFQRIQDAQRLLYFTIGLFIVALTIFIAIALFLLAGGKADTLVSSIVIGSCVTVGAVCMLRAISLHYGEVEASYETLCIETRDCEEPVSSDAVNEETKQAA